MKTIYYLVILNFWVFIAISCTSTQVTLFDELRSMNGNGPIKILTEDSLVYTFQKFNYNDTAIFGFAKIVKQNQVIERNVSIKFKKIVNIEKYTVNGWKIVWVTMFSISAVKVVTSIQPDIFSIDYNYGSGSCPYIYSYNGKDYSLEGEAFGISLGKQLESESGIILRNSKNLDEKIKLKITNERPETHFINSVRLFSYEKIKEKFVFTDNKNSIIQVSNLKKVNFDDGSNDDSLTKLISNIDNIYWESDLSSANSKSDYEDKFVINLNDVPETDSLTLIINSINTDISAIVFMYLQTALGDEYPNFVKAVDNDPEIYSALVETLERSALKIDVWDGQNWVYCNKILPEASAVNFSKAVRIPIKYADQGLVKLRLRCLSDVWKIDAVYFDDNLPSYPEMHECVLFQHKTDSHNGQNKNTILQDDNKYMTLLPDNSLELVYSVTNKNLSNELEYVVFVKGYLYEWFIDSSMIPGEILSGLNTNTPKLAFVKSILKDIDKILPVIYDEWRRTKIIRLSESR